LSRRLLVPGNITIIALPPKCPDLNPGRKRLAIPARQLALKSRSNPTTISSITAVWPGTSSSISPGASCPSDYANGRTGSDQWDLVLLAFLGGSD
jgi:hypothetical protein